MEFMDVFATFFPHPGPLPGEEGVRLISLPREREVTYKSSV